MCMLPPSEEAVIAREGPGRVERAETRKELREWRRGLRSMPPHTPHCEVHPQSLAPSSWLWEKEASLPSPGCFSPGTAESTCTCWLGLG